MRRSARRNGWGETGGEGECTLLAAFSRLRAASAHEHTLLHWCPLVTGRIERTERRHADIDQKCSGCWPQAPSSSGPCEGRKCVAMWHGVGLVRMLTFLLLCLLLLACATCLLLLLLLLCVFMCPLPRQTWLTKRPTEKSTSLAGVLPLYETPCRRFSPPPDSLTTTPTLPLPPLLPASLPLPFPSIFCLPPSPPCSRRSSSNTPSTTPIACALFAQVLLSSGQTSMFCFTSLVTICMYGCMCI